jgi:transposase InsO family protein
MKRAEVNELRRQIAVLWSQGRTVSQIARELDVSRPTVYKVIRRLDDPECDIYDMRAKNSGRPPVHEERIVDLIKMIRAKHPEWGPVFIRHWLMEQNEPAPSIREIARIINELGLAKKKVGPRDTRTYPIEKVDRAGSITLDLWGPWHIRASRIYLITVQDRWTRLSLAVPTHYLKFSKEASPGVHENLWSRAIAAHFKYHCPDAVLRRVYTDNGVGMVPAFGHLPHPVRLALLLGARVCYIPPGQPWRNGRLERFHWTMQREYWSRVQPKTIEAAEDGLVDYLNWYNHKRIHSSLGYEPPAKMYETPIEPLPKRYWEAVEYPREIDEVSGTIECARFVENEGVVELWQGDTLRLPPVLAGQYVRVEFDVNTASSEPQIGRAIWRGREEIVVAEFSHLLGVGRGKSQNLILDCVWREFSEAPRNEAYDELEYRHGRARRAFGPTPKRSE